MKIPLNNIRLIIYLAIACVVLFGGLIASIVFYSHMRSDVRNVAAILSVKQEEQKQRQKIWNSLPAFLKSHVILDQTQGLERIKKRALHYRMSNVKITTNPLRIIANHLCSLDVNLEFSIKNDDDFWNFVKDLYKMHAGIAVIQYISLEKVYDEEKGALLQGRCKLKCYGVRSLTKKSL